jgi:Protein of unknown function (DUF1553)/Protein of unknown function (DUF1549)/Planctomycete cytochrome C
MRTVALTLAIALSVAPARAGESALAGDVLPLLKARCVKCHGPVGGKGRLNLASARGLARGGENGPAVAPGKLAESPLWERVAADEMPPKEPLAPDEKAVLRRWIETGAPGLPTVAPGEPEATDHWAFAPLAQSRPSAIRDPSRARNDVDRFLLARLDAAGLTPALEANSATLIRRLTFDLTGLPPTPEEVGAFEKDTRTDAYERLVERLLAAPRYGERWGKFWLDAAGYADSNGYFNADSDRPLAYRYRDWVIRATAADRPFDQFIREQIAGDELSGYRPGVAVTPAMADALVATHFLRNAQDGTGESDGNPDEVRADRYTVLEGAVQIVGSSLLGLTIQCARCHDHKFEPITQREYYALQAVIRPAFPVENWVKPNDRVVYAAPAAEQAAWEAETKRLDADLATARAAFREWTRAHHEKGVRRFHDPFDAPLAGRWRALGTEGKTPPHLDTPTSPAAVVNGGALQILEPGDPSGRRVVTSESLDWTPDAEGQWIEASFRLVAAKVGNAASAERIGYYIAAHDGGTVPFARGNLLIDGNPAGGAAVDRGYPGPGSKGLGPIGAAKYEPGHTYGVRVTNLGDGRFRLEHVVDGEPETNALELLASDLPDGGFGFEYCCGRSFVVDDVTISTSDPKLDPATRKAQSDQREARQRQLVETVKALEARRKTRPGKIAWVADLSPNPPEAHLLKRGNYNDPGPKVDPTAPAALTDKDNPYKAKPPFVGSHSTGRRLALARWLTRPGSRAATLLARVTANRVWQHHFGTGLAATPDNLGYTGSPPSHPELLESLAAKLIESGWSLKSLHRLIVASAAYRRASTVPDPVRASKVDPDNRLLAHYPLRRLDAEAVRDAMLAVSGELDPSPFGPYVPTTRRPDGEVVVDEKESGSHRRSVYLQQRRTQVTSLLEVFDAPSIVASCPKRPVSTIPLQSLSLLNSSFAARRAEALAKRLEKEAGTDMNTRLDRAFRLIAARPPDAAEAAVARRFLETQPSRYPGLSPPEARKKAWDDLCQMLLASNAFLYVE